MCRDMSSDMLCSMFIADGVHVVVDFGESFVKRPEYFLNDFKLMIGWCADARERERHFLSTDGSADWFSVVAIDGLRFERSSGLLTSLALHVPAEISEDAPRARRWLDLPWRTGLLRLQEIKKFALAPTLRRWNDPEISAFVCFYEDTEDFSLESALRLRVAEGLDFLFSADRLIGWSLDEPARYLSDGQRDLSPPSPDHELARYLGEYLSIISYPRANSLFDGDLEVRDALNMIRRDLSSSPGDLERRSVLMHCIDEVLVQWYD